METVNIHQAKTHLSRLLDRVVRGGSFIIAKSGKPIAKVVPLGTPEPGNNVKRIGFMKGEISVPADFDSMGAEEIESDFSGRP